jgi:AraC-like DNA-binding protein
MEVVSSDEWLAARIELLMKEKVAIAAGFSDQSQLCFHFKRIAGVTPGHFRVSRIA